MREYFILFGMFFFNFWVLIRKTFWLNIWSKITEKNNFHLSKHHKLKLYNYGDIAVKLYCSKPLILFDKGFEYKTLEHLTSIVKKGDIVFDIGANIGVYTVLLSQLVGSEGKVYAFEPDPITASFLIKNLELNGCSNVQVSQIALSDENNLVSLKKPVGGGDAYNYISTNLDQVSKENLIKCMKIDDFILENNIDVVNFIKIDVEGAELLTFKGAEKLLNKTNLKIILECYEPFSQRFDYKTHDLILFLNKFNFDFTNYDEYQWLLLKK
jgi:FkbM family methyltransferase